MIGGRIEELSFTFTCYLCNNGIIIENCIQNALFGLLKYHL